MIWTFLCWFGIHRWKQTRAVTTGDIFPSPFESYENPVRWCAKCGREEYWLPGYGGSEIGCWMNRGPQPFEVKYLIVPAIMLGALCFVIAMVIRG